MRMSPEARDMIVYFEVSSKEYYKKKYERPEWPGVQSGITIGIGYDVGYATKKQLWEDWQGVIPDRMLRTLEMAVGVTGQRAGVIIGSYQTVTVPWEAAITVFDKTVVPRWEAKIAALEGSEKLNPHQFGALVSLAYNRGASFSAVGNRYREMNAIKADLASGNLARIPSHLRSMKRLWPGVKGLLIRRDKEAEMFERPYHS
jgi:GH24 family phage-related lysozyme (muramidase)